MGLTVGWYACDNTTVEDAAETLGFDLGDELEEPKRSCIAEVGPWVLVYGREPLLDDAALLKLSAGRAVVVHQSIDSMMYARSAQWADGELAWSAIVDSNSVDDDSAVVTTGLAPEAAKALRRTYAQSNASAYARIASLAGEVVGFSHDRTDGGGVRFRALIDNREKPPSVPDRVADWLIGQGFEAEDREADGFAARRFRRHIEGDFWLVAAIKPDRYQFRTDWCAIKFGIHHEATAEIGGAPRGLQRLAPDKFRPTAFVDDSVDGIGNGRPPSGDPVSFEFVIDVVRSRIAEAESYCDEERLLSICHRSAALVAEVAFGWSNRGASFLEQVKIHNRLHGPHKSGPQYLDTAWVDEHRTSLRRIELPEASRELDQIIEAFDVDEPLSGSELAVLQAERGQIDEALAESLAFEHWLRVLDHQATLSPIGAHVVRHHLSGSDADAVARAMVIPAEVQLALVERSGVKLGFNPSLDPATQLKLAERPRLHSSLGTCCDLVPEAQHLLMAEPSVYLAANPALLPELQPEFASSSSDQLRKALATNPAVLPELLAKLVNDSEGDVQHAAAQNPSLTEELQRELLDKKNRNTRNGLMANHSLVPSLQRAVAERGDLVRLARNPSLLPELMHTLVTDESATTREQIAQNPGLPLELQQRLAEDPAAGVRRSLAFNLTIDRTVVAGLCADADEAVASTARSAAYERGWRDLFT